MAEGTPPDSLHPDIERVLIDEATLQERVDQLAGQITADYGPLLRRQGGDLLVATVLRGGIYFLADLTRRLDLPLSVDVLAVLPYRGRGGAGRVRLVKDLDEDISGRHVLLVEDIVDTGLTLSYILDVLRARRPRSLAVATLLDRPALRLADDLCIRYTGFEIPDDFVVGYGLDFRERYRNLPYIGILRDDVFRRQVRP